MNNEYLRNKFSKPAFSNCTHSYMGEHPYFPRLQKYCDLEEEKVCLYDGTVNIEGYLREGNEDRCLNFEPMEDKP